MLAGIIEHRAMVGRRGERRCRVKDVWNQMSNPFPRPAPSGLIPPPWNLPLPASSGGLISHDVGKPLLRPEHDFWHSPMRARDAHQESSAPGETATRMDFRHAL